MNYEQKYKDACNRYKSWLAKQEREVREAVMSAGIFPELQESEDEKMLRQLHSWMKEFGVAEDYTEKVYNWIKGLLEGQTEQKPVKWSEEDINMIDWLIRCCEKEHEELCNDKYGHQEIVSDLKRDCRKKWDWLESLKSKVTPQNHWKPSEEQI